MKNFFAILALTVLTASAAYAQDGGQIGYGIKGGVNFANLVTTNASGNNITDQKVRIGYLAGVYVKAGITDYLFIQPELLYSAKGNTYKVGGFKNTTNLGYIDLPIVLMVRVAKTLTFHAGPQFSYLAVGNLKYNHSGTETTVENKNAFRPFDFGAVAGLGVELKPVNFTLRYQYGFLNVLKDGVFANNNAIQGPEFRNSVLSLALGFEI